MSTTDEVIDAIDHTLTDFDTSPDAMRWTPEEPPALPPPGVLASRREVTITVTADISQFQAAMAEAADCWRAVIQPLFVKVHECTAALANLQRQMESQRRSAMWTAYRARSRRRTRSNR